MYQNLQHERNHVYQPKWPYPRQSQRGNKYIMYMVKIDRHAILVEPMKSRKDAEIIQAYDTLILFLRCVGIGSKRQHYSVHNCYIKDTRSQQLSDTVAFKYQHITNPTLFQMLKQPHECTCKCHQGPTVFVNGKSDHKLRDFQQGVAQAECKIVHQQPQSSSNSTTEIGRAHV